MMLLTYLYEATVIRCIDGDSVVFDIDCGFGISLKNQSVRLYGIDTSETRGGTEDLKILGHLAKDFVVGLLPVGSKVLLKTYLDKRGKFGRIMADIHVKTGDGYDDTSVNQMLLDECLAVPYAGQSKEDILNQHLIHVEHHRSKGSM
jgi:endonuclease YncB( thermonuclease family)|tara:strand:- start:290 stop:730 length:441 start_codon:yes stop_codon:yes gene_type:complete